MFKKLFNILIVSLICISTTAQKNKIRFQSINSFGLIGGESPASTAYQTVNGIRFSNWFSGIGIGIDNYQYKTLPLFFDLRRYFGSEKKIFVYGDLGYNFPVKDKPGKEMIYYGNYHFKGGIYTELGIGFKTKFIKRSSILFSVGQSYKQLQSQVGNILPCDLCSSYWYNYKLDYGRIILKTGIEF